MFHLFLSLISHDSILIEGVPHVQQKPDFCGEACVEMWLEKLDHAGDQDWVFDQSGLDPKEGRGVYTRELAVALRAIGFEPGSVWYRVAADDRDALDGLFRDLLADLRAGVPSIVCMHYDDKPRTTEHFRLILGYDKDSDEVVYHEPAEKQGAYRRMKRERMMKLWPLKYDRGEWTVIRLRLDPKELKPYTPQPRYTDADYAQRVQSLRERLDDRFTIVIEKPFVVIGDDDPDDVRRFAERAVRWSVTKLKAEYFAGDPNALIDVWLFKDEASYLANTQLLFNETPTTPYGYYSQAHRALIMNIATGGGTLVHEIVHPFVEANFPEAPDWLNEGLGSLYEQSDERDGRIVGLTNWRLAGLQRAIRLDALPSFAELTSAAGGAFYTDDPGTNYAQARYLLYYLQEKGLLQSYYRSFYAKRKTDPTGYRTLIDILGEKDMAAFQRRWERWVLALRFP